MLLPKLLLGIACAVVPSLTTGEVLADFIDEVMAKNSERLEGVDHYVERPRGGELPGMSAALGPSQQGRCLSACRAYLTFATTTRRGEERVSVLLSPLEVMELTGLSPDAAALVSMSTGYGFMQDAMQSHAGEMLGPFAGLAGIFGEIPNNQQVQMDLQQGTWTARESNAPWLNPFRMFGGGSFLFMEMAVAVENAQQSLANKGSEAQAQADAVNEALDGVRMVEIDRINGQSAVRVELPMPESATRQISSSAGGTTGSQATFAPRSASIWIDPSQHVILQHRLVGIATAEGQSREFSIETINSDFRHVPGSRNLYLPYKRTMRMRGLLDDEQAAQMDAARQQLEQFDAQLAAMPAQERQMLEKMIGGQMDALRGSSGGDFQYEEIIDEILVNPDLKALYGGNTTVSLIPSQGNTLQRIQVHLEALGYEPGNIAGVLDTMTTVAISQYQAEHGLPVTGEPSEALLNRLAAAAAETGGN